MNQVKQQLWIGWLFGLLAPVIGFWIFSAIYFEHQSIMDVFMVFKDRNVLPHVISLSVIINLVFFFGFLKTNRDAAARGVLGATFIYVFIVIYFKFC
jgi:hypothetical protein